MTLRRQLLLAISFVFLLIFIGLLLLSISSTRHYLEEQLGSQSQEAATSLAHTLAQSLGKDDTVLAETQVVSFFDRGYFQRIAVISPQGKLLVDKASPVAIEAVPGWFSNLVRLNVPGGEAFISAGWRQLGKVAVMPQPTLAYQHLWATTQETLLWMAAMYAVAVGLALLLLRVILHPLAAIEAASIAIGERRFDQIGHLPRARELLRVVQAINAMSRRVSDMLDGETARAEQFRKEAYQDDVTGLENRRGFDLRFNQLLKTETGAGRGVLLAAEINDLKDFNTRHGYQAGNRVLLAMTEIIRHGFGQQISLMGRIGGGSIAAVLAGLEGEQALNRCRQVQQELLALLAEDPETAAAAFSFGLVPFSAGEQRSQLMARLDLALESARQNQRNAVHCLNPDTVGQSDALGSTGWRDLIQKALDERHLKLMLQPSIWLANEQPLHEEVTTRLLDNEGNPVPAAKFLPMALRHNLMPEIDRTLTGMVFDALQQGADLPATLALNLSLPSVRSREFMLWLERQLQGLGALARRLSFELSEYGCIQDTESARQLAVLVRRHGCKFGIDHFGLNPESLALLRHIPPDYLKLDGGLSRDFASDDKSRALLQSIITLAHSLDVTVIAQQIESPEQRAILGQHQVDAGQGYHWGAPAEANWLHPGTATGSKAG